MNKQIDATELDFLLRFPAIPNVSSPVDFLSNHCWGGIKALSNMEQFRNLDRDIEVYRQEITCSDGCIARYCVCYTVMMCVLGLCKTLEEVC